VGIFFCYVFAVHRITVAFLLIEFLWMDVFWRCKRRLCDQLFGMIHGHIPDTDYDANHRTMFDVCLCVLTECRFSFMWLYCMTVMPLVVRYWLCCVL